MNRIRAFNEANENIFYDNLKLVINKYHNQSDKIFKVDETAISAVKRNSKIFAGKGEKQVGKATSAKIGSTTTVVCAFSTAGQYIPPKILYY